MNHLFFDRRVTILVLNVLLGISLSICAETIPSVLPQSAAKTDLAKSLFQLGLRYAKGKGVPKDEAEAAKWTRKAAGQGHTSAQRQLGVLYTNGQGVAQNDAEAAAWFRRAAEQGQADAQSMLGANLADTGAYVESLKWLFLAESSWSRDAANDAKQVLDLIKQETTPAQIAEGKRQAVEWRETSKGHAAIHKSPQRTNGKNSEASKQFELGMSYMIGGKGVEKNEELGIKLIEKSAIQGYEKAEYELGIRYWEGKGVRQDYALGEKWLKKAAEKDNPMAQMILADAYYKGGKIPQNDKEAIRLCKILVDPFPGHGVVLGDYYSKGVEVPLDHKIAADYFKRAAEYGDETGQMRLAYCYVDGQGVPQSDANAVVWFKKAAEQGNSVAQECLGIAYSIGKGVEEDMVKAAHWRERAANSGNVGCQFKIGVHYLAGQGVPKDNVLAYKWLNIAAASGSEEAGEMREKAASAMTPEQIAEAQKLSREWKSIMPK